MAGDRVKGIYIHFDPNNPIPRIPIWNTISVLSRIRILCPFSSTISCFFFSPLASRCLLLLLLLLLILLLKLRPAQQALKLRASSVSQLSPLFMNNLSFLYITVFTGRIYMIRQKYPQLDKIFLIAFYNAYYFSSLYIFHCAVLLYEILSRHITFGVRFHNVSITGHRSHPLVRTLIVLFHVPFGIRSHAFSNFWLDTIPLT